MDQRTFTISVSMKKLRGTAACTLLFLSHGFRENLWTVGFQLGVIFG